MLKIIAFNNRSTTEIQVAFDQNLDTGIGISNIRISSDIPSIDDLTVKSILIVDNVIAVTCSPQVPMVNYYIEFFSTDFQQFASADGDVIQEEPNSNKIYFLGLELQSTIRDSLISNTPPVYDATTHTIVRKHISNIADQATRLNTEIGKLGNANYIYETVVDERKTRGFGPIDRLENESTFEVFRVSSVPTGSAIAGKLEFNDTVLSNLLGNDADKGNVKVATVGTDPISLRSKTITETVSNAEMLVNKFDGLIITLSKNNVAKINSIILTRSNDSSYTYNIPLYKYALKDNRYDTLNCNKLSTLDNNQLRLSEAAILALDFVVPSGSDELEINYTYTDNGIDVDSSTVSVTKVIEVTREAIGAFQNIFSLKNFPLVDSFGKDIYVDGVEFLDPTPDSGLPFSSTHPAFVNEIAYSAARLPAAPGEFSIDYATGRVFVYGELASDGTGSGPPTASYFYRKTYLEGIDYSFDSDNDELVVISGRDLATSEAKISFRYDQVLTPGVDYLAKTHIEVINEFVDNRVVGTDKISVLNHPITDVFEVVNETTGEKYGITRFDDYNIYINGRKLPSIKSKELEVANFSRVSDEELFIVEDVQSLGGGQKIVKSQFSKQNVISSLGNLQASSVNTSVIFSSNDIFVNELFYDSILQNLTTNLAKLTSLGDFLIDYSTSEIYVRVEDDQDTSLGRVSYNYGLIDTLNSNVLSVDSLGYRGTTNSSEILAVSADSITSDGVLVESLPSSLERFLLGDTDKPIVLGAVQYGIVGQTVLGSSIFRAPDATFDSSHDDGYHILRFPGDTDRAILSVNSSYEVVVDIPFNETNRNVSWCLINTFLSDGYTCITSHDPVFIRGIYKVEELQSLPRSVLTNYYNGTTDTVIGNVITLNSDAALQLTAGDALAVDYSFGPLLVTYNYVADNIRVSYEYGDNSLDFSVGDALSAGDEYFVSYRYGALRNKLLTNFGILTQVDDLATFPLDFNRELYRDFIRGALASFVKGPTTSSISSLVETVTGIPPQIRELSFDEWTSDRDNLYLDEAKITGTESYVSGKFDTGIVIDADTTIEYPEESYISYKEGTIEAWIRPNWNGIDNDATLTFDLGQDGYSASASGSLLSTGMVSYSDIYVGLQGWHPEAVPFSVNRADILSSPVGKPLDFGSRPGYFIWYDDLINSWNLSWAFDPTRNYRFTGMVTTSGEFYNVRDGYNSDRGDSYVEASDKFTSTKSYIKFDASIDGYEVSDGYDGYEYSDGYLADDGYTTIAGSLFHDLIQFSSDDVHYIMDAGASLDHNRMSIFKDGSGFLNFRVFDDTGRLYPGRAKQYNISHDISNWENGNEYFISAAWRFNSVDGIDEMHLGVDGVEVSNLLKFGGAPPSDSTDIFRTVADDIVVLSSPKTIVGLNDGSTNSSNIFVSLGSSFITDGIVAGDLLTILDPTADGAGSPYTIAAVISETVLQLTTSLLLALDNVSFSVNRAEYVVQSNIDTEKFAVFAYDGVNRRELNGLDSENPDYSVVRDGGNNTLVLLKNINAGDEIIINTLGLTTGRCRDIIYNYTAGSTIKTRLPPPVNFDHFDMYKVLFMRTSIVDGGGSVSGTGSFSALGNELSATFTDICQPSNTSSGKKMKVTLGGLENIDFTGTNEVIINGTTFGGPITEIITFSSYSAITTSNYFTSITSIDMTFTGIDANLSFGSIELVEAVSITRSENGGDYAQPIAYFNGRLSFVIYGSGGLPYTIDACYYRFDYPLKLTIPMTQKDKLFIGSDLSGNNQLDGVLDQLVILNEMLDDIRTGEAKGATRTVTEDYNSVFPATVTPQTLMLLNFNNKIKNLNKYYKTYAEDFYSGSNSVNTAFSDALVVLDSKPFVIDNGSGIVNNNAGTIEFWISPYIDVLHDMDQTRYYVDITSQAVDQITSINAKTIILPSRARSVSQVRLTTDDGSGINYFDDGELLADGLTIILGSRLPAQNTTVSVTYTPIDFMGDRISIYKDGYGNINFGIAADESSYIISYPISWTRNTWHRVMATWTANSLDGKDRMRLFIDGVESGTITYGTPGLLWGSGIIYGQAAIGSLDATFLTANIDLTDTLGNIFVGNSFDEKNSAKAKFDNLRFSSIARDPSIVANTPVDLNYNSNTDAVSPVLEDAFTTAIYDFDRELDSTEFLANLLDETTPLYLFDVFIDDGFRRLVDNTRAKNLLITLIKRMKPSHANLFTKYLQDD